MSVQGFHTIVLQVSDLPQSIDFYTVALGLEFVRQSNRAAQAKLGPSALLLHTEYEVLPSPRGAGVHINFSVANVHEHHSELRANGLAPGPVSVKPWGSQFTLSDPDGYVIEFLGPAV
ncbi:MAG: VOC family protein [Myxococcota bacterium]